MRSLDSVRTSKSQVILPRYSSAVHQRTEDAGHTSEVVDLYAIRFDPVFRMQDFASYVHESIPLDILEQMNLKQHVLDSAGGPIQRFIASRWLRNKDTVDGGEIHPRTSTQRLLLPSGKK